MGKTHTWKPPDQSSLHNFAEQAALHRSDANFIFFKDKDYLTAERPSGWPAMARRTIGDDLSVCKIHSHQHQNLGGAERDRTADPLLAKQVLSQLSYSPIQVSIT